MSRLSKPIPLTEKLDALLKKAKTHVMTPEERRAQRISFVYGQLMDCGRGITKDQIAQRHDEIYGNPNGDKS